MACNFPNQITNRNFLSPVGFKFTLAKEPKVAFFCNSARIPEITLSIVQQPNYLKDLDIPGGKLLYGDLSLRFMVDEDMENYMAIHNWLTGLGFPETTQQYADLVEGLDGEIDPKKAFSDGTLYILDFHIHCLLLNLIQRLLMFSTLQQAHLSSILFIILKLTYDT
jgi:hypothetical protein